MIARRIKFGIHAAAEVSSIFDEELAKLAASGKEPGSPETLREARRVGEAMIARGAFDPV